MYMSAQLMNFYQKSRPGPKFGAVANFASSFCFQKELVPNATMFPAQLDMFASALK